MEQSMRRFTKAGVTLHVSYPQLGEGDGPILECLERTCGGDYLEAAGVTRMRDPQVRKRATEMIRMAHMVPAYGDQSRALSARLNINDLDETRRAMAVDTLREGIDEAYEMGYAGFPSLSGRYEEGRKEQVFEQLLKSTGELCRHAEKKGQMSVCYEVFGYDIDKKALIGPAILTVRYAGEIREEHGSFGLPVDLSHIPTIYGTIEESILPVKDYIIHAHMGNAVIKSPSYEACGDNHPRFGSPNSGNGVEELTHYLRTSKGIGFLGERDWSVVSFKVKSWKGEPPKAVIANARYTLNLTWELV